MGLADFSPFRSRRRVAPVKTVTQHEIILGGQIIPFVVSSGLKRLSLKVDGKGLRVGMPHGMALAEVERFIRHHGAWVLEKLAFYQTHSSAAVNPSHAAQHIQHGSLIPLLGGQVSVLLSSGNNRFRWFDSAVELALRPTMQAQPLLRKALQQKAFELFAERISHYRTLGGFPAVPLTLSSARTRWGSCSSRSGIRLNWRLIHLALPLIDYVVIHELCHLREMNHSARFWAEVAQLCPDWQHKRSELKRLGAKVPQY